METTFERHRLSKLLTLLLSPCPVKNICPQNHAKKRHERLLKRKAAIPESSVRAYAFLEIP